MCLLQRRGTDPYDQLSALSKCGSCDGAGTKVVASPPSKCGFCHGSGSYKTFRCPICGSAEPCRNLTAQPKLAPTAKGCRASRPAASPVSGAGAAD